MSNPPKKFSKNVTMKYGALLEKWRKTQTTSTHIVTSMMDTAFKSLRIHMFKEIMRVINTDNGLTKYDEDIFKYYKHLIQYYEKAVTYYEHNRSAFVSVKITELLDGLCAVFSSQINQFQESLTLTEGVAGEDRETNPIAIEKKNILEREVLLFIEKIDCIKTRVRAEQSVPYMLCLLDELQKEQGDFDALVSKLYQEIIDTNQDVLYDIYKESIKSSVTRLNDLQSREVTQFYYELLKEEKENLAAVIKIQTAAVDAETKTKDEEILVHELFSIIREGYQYTLKEVAELTDKFREIEQKGMTTNPLPPHDFQQKIEAPLHLEAEVTQLENDFHEFQVFFEQFICDMIESKLKFPNVSLYQMKKMITEESLLSDELNTAFMTIEQYTTAHKELLSACAYKEIVMGILETIQIKTENIKESTKEFIQECETSLTTFETNKKTLTEEERAALVEGIFKKSLAILVTAHEKMHDIDDCIASNLETQLEREAQGQINRMNQKIARFCKEQLLYEVSTFEEIMHYSVSRLREATDETVVEYVQMIDQAVAVIEAILKKYNIQTIRPKPHDMFNGKEHDVLVAEKNKDFQKGEIIKLMNSGYKKENLFIIRANVIAAK